MGNNHMESSTELYCWDSVRSCGGKLPALLFSSDFEHLTEEINGFTTIDFKVGYSSPAEAGIRDELGLSLAEVCEKSMFLPTLLFFFSFFFGIILFIFPSPFLLDEELVVYTLTKLR